MFPVANAICLEFSDNFYARSVKYFLEFVKINRNSVEPALTKVTRL